MGFSDASAGKRSPAIFDLVGRGQDLGFAFAFARHITHADGAAEEVAVVSGGNHRYDPTVAHDRLVVGQQRLGLSQSELDEPALQALLALSQHGVAADEITLRRLHREAEAGFQNVILVGDVVAEMPECPSISNCSCSDPSSAFYTT
jgi:hypothetical protein